MTKSVYLVVFYLLSNLLFSQEMLVGTKDYLAPSPEKNTANARSNQNTSDMIINGVLVDKRVISYYNNVDELQTVSAEKLKTLNEIYVSSFQLITSKNILSEKCLSFIEKELNLGDYNNFRLKSQRKEITVNHDNCLFKILLFSWDEINRISK